MQVCAACQYTQLDGIIFCDACGALLMRACGSRLPAELVTKRLDASTPAHDARTPGPLQDWCLHLVDRGRKIRLPLAPQLIIGRGVRAQLDLNLDPEGTPAGVSANHALLLATAHGWEILDLSSTNGTYVNYARISAAKPTKLYSGDNIHFGALHAVMRARVI